MIRIESNWRYHRGTKAKLPNFLRRLSSDEYQPVPYTAGDRRVVADAQERIVAANERNDNTSAPDPMRRATAAGLVALNEEAGAVYYEVPPDAAVDRDTADDAFARSAPVIDVQTRYVAPRFDTWKSALVKEYYESMMPDWWTELSDIESYGLADYIRNVFIECRTSIAVSTSGPGQQPADRSLFNDEISMTRAVVDEFARKGPPSQSRDPSCG